MAQLEKVRVWGTDYKIDRTDEAEGWLGLFESQKERIRLKSGQTKLEECDALLHEVLHAIEYKCGLDHNEQYVRSFGTGLVGVFRDNPELLSYIKKAIA